MRSFAILGHIGADALSSVKPSFTKVMRLAKGSAKGTPSAAQLTIKLLLERMDVLKLM